MGCASSGADKGGEKQQNKAAPKQPNLADDPTLNDTERSVARCSEVVLENDYFKLRQVFAFVRHGDRLDHTREWKSHDDYKNWINDTPLTQEGHQHATAAGKGLKELADQRKVPFSLIVASPYFRCAQTASRIAQVLRVPVHFDIDLGEVFDNVSMKGDHLDGSRQFKSPQELEARLKVDFKDSVEYIRDDAGAIKFEGKLQKFPEDFEAARMRYAYKTKKLLQKAASELMSICIVSHGDGVASVVGMLKEDWAIQEVPYTAYVFGCRKVKVLKKGGDELLKEEPVYKHPEEWELKLDKKFNEKVRKITSPSERKDAHAMHEQEMKAMDAQGRRIKTDYTLDDEQHKAYMQALDHLDAHDEDSKHMLHKAASSHHMNDKNTRVKCAPQH
jgi:broad specificity phosphatase PhoE